MSKFKSVILVGHGGLPTDCPQDMDDHNPTLQNQIETIFNLGLNNIRKPEWQRISLALFQTLREYEHLFPLRELASQ